MPSQYIPKYLDKPHYVGRQPTSKLLIKLALLDRVTNDYRDELKRWITKNHPELANIEPDIQRLLRQRAGRLVEDIVERDDYPSEMSLQDYFRNQKTLAEDVVNELEKRDTELRQAEAKRDQAEADRKRWG